MLAGRLKDQIHIYAENQSEPNDFSERIKTYSFSFALRAEISYLNGQEKMHGQMLAADRTLKFKVRFHIDRFNERQVILWRGDYYNIRSIDPDRNRAYLILTGERAPTDTLNIEES